MTRKASSVSFSLFVIFTFAFVGKLNAHDLNGRVYADERIMYTFHEKTLEIETWRSTDDGGVLIIEVPYKIAENFKIPFLYYGKNYEHKYLIMHNHLLMYLYNSKEELDYVGIRLYTGVGIKHLNVIGGVSIGTKSSSFLREGSISYLPQNIETPPIGFPWVEGVAGYGIGEWIDINISPYEPSVTLAIMNGYVSYQKPYLYEQNSRIKKMEISGNNNTMLVELPDSPALYEIKVDSKFGARLRLTIKDIYPGTKWKDTCLESIKVYPSWKLTE